MTFMGRKVATKDVDIVFGSTRDTKDFIASIRLVGFEYVGQPSSEYNALGDSAIMEDTRGMRFDIFDRRVCRALELGEAMKSLEWLENPTNSFVGVSKQVWRRRWRPGDCFARLSSAQESRFVPRQPSVFLVR